MNLQDLIIKIEIAISKLGINPGQAKQAEGQYNISKDQKVQIYVDAFEENGSVFFQILSPFMNIPSNNPTDFLKKLLSENHGLVEASFAIIDNSVYIKHTVEEKGQLTEDAVIVSLQRIAYYTELFSEKWDSGNTES